MKIRPAKHQRSGITLSEVILLLVVLGTLLFILLPAMFLGPGRRKGSSQIKCSSQLKQIGLGIKLWAGDHLGKYPWQVSTNQGGTMEWAFTPEVYRHFLALSNELGNPRVLVCPGDSERTNNSSFADPMLNNQSISYFVGLSAADKGPVIPLAGDRYLVVNNKLGQGVVGLTASQIPFWDAKPHKGSGNILLIDGGVHCFRSDRLNEVFLGQSLIASGLTTNWLAIP